MQKEIEIHIATNIRLFAFPYPLFLLEKRVFQVFTSIQKGWLEECDE